MLPPLWLCKSAAVLLAVAAVIALPQRSQAQGTESLLKLLDKQIETKEFQAALLTVKEAFSLLIDKIKKQEGADLPILVDTEAFRAEHPDAPDAYDAKVQFPPFPQKMTVATAIRFILSRVETRNATYVVLPDVVLVTTLDKAHPVAKLKEKVRGTFEKRPLHSVLRELGESIGANIVIDNRVGDKAKAEITASFVNGTSLAGALRVVTDMADLKVIMLDDAIYVTTPAHVETLRNEVLTKMKDTVERKAMFEKSGAKPSQFKIYNPLGLTGIPGFMIIVMPDWSIDPLWPYTPEHLIRREGEYIGSAKKPAPNER